MLPELILHPELGFLHARTQVGFPNVLAVQYWSSYEMLEVHGSARDRAYLPA